MNLLKRPWPLLAILVGLMAIGFQQPRAEPSGWQFLGGPPGTVAAIVVDPRNTEVIYAAAGDGVYKSTDAGDSWRIAGRGLPGASYRALALDPQRPATIYAGGSEDRNGHGTPIISRSTDGGGTWERLDLGDQGEWSSSIQSIAVASDDSNVIYASIERRKILVSTDGGATWRSEKPVDYDLWPAMAVDPVNSQNVYLAGVKPVSAGMKPPYGRSSYQAVVYKSTDGAHIWREITTGLPDITGFRPLVIHPMSPDLLYAGASTKGVYRSTDGGESWQGTSKGLPEGSVVESLAVDPQNPEIVYAGIRANDSEEAAGQPIAGVYRSDNAGETWQRVWDGQPSTFPAVLAVASSAPGTIYAGTSGFGTYRSQDRGSEWTAINRGLAGGEVRSLAIDPGPPKTIYVIAGGALYKTMDGGNTWDLANRGIAEIPPVGLGIDPGKQPATIFLGAPFSKDGSARLYKSEDGGELWIPTGTGILRGAQIKSMVFDPADPLKIYAAASCCMGSPGLYASSDGGQNWVRLWQPPGGGPENGLGGVNALVIDGQSFYAGTGRGVYKSTDSGKTWQEASEGIPTVKDQPWPGANGLPSSILSLVMDPQQPDTLYAAGMGGVYKSTDGAVTWQESSQGIQFVGDEPPWVSSLVINPGCPSILYAGLSGGVYRSLDGGASWEKVRGSLLNNLNVEVLVLDPIVSSKVYAGTRGNRTIRGEGGLFRMHDTQAGRCLSGDRN